MIVLFLKGRSITHWLVTVSILFLFINTNNQKVPANILDLWPTGLWRNNNHCTSVSFWPPIPFLHTSRTGISHSSWWHSWQIEVYWQQQSAAMNQLHTYTGTQAHMWYLIIVILSIFWNPLPFFSNIKCLTISHNTVTHQNSHIELLQTCMRVVPLISYKMGSSFNF